jgi:hypothetical protein
LLTLLGVLLLASVLRARASTGADAVTLLQLSADPYTNPTSQHQTQVEPDTFAYGSTIVAAFQSGRFNGSGASNIGWATSHDGGASWSSGFLPGITLYEGAGLYDRASDPSVAYSARDDVWLVSVLAIAQTWSVVVSRSTNGGTAWGVPVAVSPGGESTDKNWTVCDNSPVSPYYGRCYTEWDGAGGIKVSTSIDGGVTWGAATKPLAYALGFGGQPVVQSNGVVIVLYDGSSAIMAFRSTDGGATWSNPISVAPAVQQRVAGGLRVLPAPSAEVDAAGKVYVAWQDCSFRVGCASHDIVISSSTDGLSWSPPLRVPIDDLGSSADHFIPGLGVDSTTFGDSAHLGLAFYYYPAAECSPATCQLSAGFIASTDGGATWGAPMHLAGPMCLSWLPQTTQGTMVGDYISTSFADGSAYPVFAAARAPHDGLFDQAIYSVQGGVDPLSPPTSPLTTTTDPALCPTIFLPSLSVGE